MKSRVDYCNAFVNCEYAIKASYGKKRRKGKDREAEMCGMRILIQEGKAVGDTVTNRARIRGTSEAKCCHR